jgi:hypothetical protein
MTAKGDQIQEVLDDLDGDVGALLVAFVESAKFHEWPEAEITRVLQEATSGDLEHLLETLGKRLGEVNFD